MHLIYSIFIILPVIFILETYGSEVELLLKKEREYLNNLSNTQNGSTDKPHRQSKGKLSKKYTSTHKEGNSMATNISVKLTKYLKHIKQQGVKTLNYIGKDVTKNIEHKSITFKINTAQENYVQKIQNYYDYITGPKSIIIADKPFLLLDVCEIACRILYQQQKLMLLDVLANLSSTENTNDYTSSMEGIDIVTEKTTEKLLDDKINNITKTIFSYNTNLRTKEMKYICKKYAVCRPYPSFTDYCGYFLSEILKLPSGKFAIMSKVMGMILRLNNDVMLFMSEITNYETFTTDVNDMCNNDTKLQETFHILKDIFSQKFSIIRNPALDYKMRGPALRILLDIMDKSFKGQNRKEFITNFDTTVASIRKWANNEIPSISLEVGKVCDNIFRYLNNIANSVKTNRKYLLVLIAMITEGNSAEYANSVLHII